MSSICFSCGSDCESQRNPGNDSTFYVCPICGRFELNPFKVHELDYNKLASYLLYNGFHDSNNSSIIEYRYHCNLDKSICDKYRDAFNNGDKSHSFPVHMDSDIIENWYPKTFAEKIDCILLYINKCTKHMGQIISWNFEKLLSALFIDRYDITFNPNCPNTKKQEKRNEYDCANEATYMLDSLVESGFIKYTTKPAPDESTHISLTPIGYSRVDVLQKNLSYGHTVLIAMKFGNETLKLREAIRKGVSDAGYKAIFIDEVQHNDFITPELLKHIQDSKFVVVDLTHQNNGAYFEEGYAMGLGKPVIQLCKEGVDLHFDIAQKNTIIWETEDEIPSRLTARIKATIN